MTVAANWVMGGRGQGIPVVVINDTRVDRHHGCSRVMSAVENLLHKNGMTVTAYSPAHADWRDEAVLAELSNSALVLVNGEGTIHHNRPSGLRLLEVGAYARELGIPAALINFSWEANDHHFLAKLADFSLISARDSEAATQIRAAGLQCRVVPDLSLYVEAENNIGRRSGFGFTDSVLRDASLDLERARRNMKALAMPIQYSARGALGAWRFLREYVGKGDLRSPSRVARLLACRMAQFNSQVSTPPEYIARLAGLELLVSGRFHACSLALLAMTPFVAAGTNSHKIHSLISDIGLSKWRVDLPLEKSELDQARRQGWDAGERDAIDAYVAAARFNADALFRDIRRLV